MRPLRRGNVNKRRSSKQFRRNSARTKGANIQAVMRGGIRL